MMKRIYSFTAALVIIFGLCSFQNESPKKINEYKIPDSLMEILRGNDPVKAVSAIYEGIAPGYSEETRNKLSLSYYRDTLLTNELHTLLNKIYKIEDHMGGTDWLGDFDEWTHSGEHDTLYFDKKPVLITSTETSASVQTYIRVIKPSHKYYNQTNVINLIVDVKKENDLWKVDNFRTKPEKDYKGYNFKQESIEYIESHKVYLYNPPVKVSIIGASIDTYKGYIPKEYNCYYPKKGTVGTPVTKISQTWWRIIIDQKMPNGWFWKNLSFSGSSVTAASPTAIRKKYGDKKPYWAGYSYAERFIAHDGLGDPKYGDPDLIFIHGGGNDLSHETGPLYVTEDGRRYELFEKFEFPYSMMTEAFTKAEAAKTWDEAASLADSTFVDAYLKLLRLIQIRHPKARVVHYFTEFIPTHEALAIRMIADHYGHCCVDLRPVYYKIQRLDPSKKRPNGLHPSAEGMQVIADEIWRQAGDYIQKDMTPKE